MNRFLLFLVVVTVLTLTFSACAPGAVERDETSSAGFFWGIWHGWIAPISLIWHFFNPEIRIYEVNNTGWWYDLGFYIALIGGFGSISIFRKKR